MDKLVEDYLTRAITERFEESLKEPDKCHKARDDVISVSLKEYREHRGYGVSRETIAKALELMVTDLETAQARTARWSALAEQAGREGKQALLEGMEAKRDLEAAQSENATLHGQLAAYGAPDINGASMITNAGLGKDESEEQ